MLPQAVPMPCHSFSKPIMMTVSPKSNRHICFVMHISCHALPSSHRKPFVWLNWIHSLQAASPLLLQLPASPHCIRDQSHLIRNHPLPGCHHGIRAEQPILASQRWLFRSRHPVRASHTSRHCNHLILVSPQMHCLHMLLRLWHQRNLILVIKHKLLVSPHVMLVSHHLRLVPHHPRAPCSWGLQPASHFVLLPHMPRWSRPRWLLQSPVYPLPPLFLRPM